MSSEATADKAGTYPNGKLITLAALAQAKGLPVAFLEELGLHDLPQGGVGIPYYDDTAEQLFVRERESPKPKSRFYQPQGQPLAAYGDWRIGDANKDGILLLVEGESDCWTLWYHAIPALGIPGSNAAKVLTREHLARVQKVYVCREPDQGGDTFVKGVVNRLKELAFDGKAFEIRCPQGVKDPSDLHVQVPDQKEFCQAFQEIILAAVPLRGAAPGNSSGSPDLPDPPEDWEPPVLLGQVPEAAPFPEGVLPAAVEKFVKDVAFARACPPDYAALPVLVIAGSAIGASRVLEIKQGWRERPCLYGAVVGPPGSAKTPALKAVAGPVYDEQTRRLAQYKRDKQAWEEDKEGRPVPKLETVYVNDITIEKLAAVLQDNERGVVLIRDELTAWVTGMNQYRSQGKGADRQAYLSIWAGEPIRVDRKNQDDPVFIPHPFVGVIGGLPPALLPQLRGEKALWDGFLDRVLIAYAEPLPAKGEDWACLSDESIQFWKKVLAHLWGLQPALSDYGKCPRVLYLTVCGRRAWERLTARLAAELNRDDLPDAAKGHLAKAKGHAARLALIIHLLRQACGEDVPENVDGESVDRAGRLADYFYNHCLKAHAALGADREVEDALKVVHWIARERRKEFKRWEVHKDIKTQEHFQRIEDLDRPLDRLLKHQYIRVRHQGTKSGPGRPPDPVYEVNPLWDRRENRVNRANPPPAPGGQAVKGYLPDSSGLLFYGGTEPPGDGQAGRGDAWEGDER
jgi:hypothetical protein